jgi:hypothetical protein
LVTLGALFVEISIETVAMEDTMRHE